MGSDDVFGKVKATAAAAGQAAVKAAEETAKSAERLLEVTKLQYKIYETQGALDALYKEAGRLTYEAQRGAENDRLAALWATIDGKKAELDMLRARRAKVQNRKICPVCGQTVKGGQPFCGGCGAQMPAETEESNA